MKVIIENEKRDDVEIEQRSITIRLNKDVDFKISITKFGELEIQKSNFGSGNNGISIHPNVSNEIRLT